jgi:hypothetical protein
MLPSIHSPETKSERTPEAFDVHPAAVDAWVDNLPLADVSRTCGLVFNALAETNTRNLSPPSRYRLLERLREPVHYLTDALSRRFANSALPLAPQTSRIAALLYGLQLEIAKGYQCIVNPLLALEGLRQDFNLLAVALQRALCHYGQALFTGYQVYRPVPPGLWRTLHGLYDAAERKGVQRSPIKDPFYSHDQVTTIEGQYKQGLLLSLADPPHLAQDDMGRLALLLGPWTAHCRLYRADDLDAPADGRLVDLSSDLPPMRAEHRPAAPDSGYRLLDLAPLLEVLRHGLMQAPPAGFRAAVARGLPAEQLWQSQIRHLLAAWGPATRRAFTRNDGGLAEMQLLVGLSGCHRLLNEDDDTKMAIPFSFGQGSPRTLRRAANLDEELVASTMVINEGANGICLRWVDAFPGRVRVNEVLALRRSRADQWGVGAVRWLKTLGHRGLELGVELLGPEMIPVRVRHCDEGENQREYLKALYLPEVPALRQPARLLLPASFFRTDEVVSLRMGLQVQRLRLVKAAESNGVFSRFLFISEP